MNPVAGGVYPEWLRVIEVCRFPCWNGETSDPLPTK